MSTRRQKAIEFAPELKTEFQASDLTPYTVFIELLPLTRKAHLNKDNEKFEKFIVMQNDVLNKNRKTFGTQLA
jgi:hypothetical protein